MAIIYGAYRYMYIYYKLVFTGFDDLAPSGEMFAAL